MIYPMFLTNLKLCFLRMTLISLSRSRYQNCKFFRTRLCEYSSALKPQSHIACNRSATSLRPKFRVVGCRVVARRWATGCRRLQGRFGRKEVLVTASETSLRPNRSHKGFWWSPTGCLQVADWLATDRRPVAVVVVADNPDTVFSRRLIADQSPIGCRPISKKLQTVCNQKQTLKIQPPTSCRPIANRLPIAPQSIADWLPTDRLRVGKHCLITRQHSINTRSLSASESMLDLFPASSSDINLKAISWRQFDKRYVNHRSLKMT